MNTADAAYMIGMSGKTEIGLAMLLRQMHEQLDAVGARRPFNLKVGKSVHLNSPALCELREQRTFLKDNAP